MAKISKPIRIKLILDSKEARKQITALKRMVDEIIGKLDSIAKTANKAIRGK